jgi:hypothetical protein
VSSHGRFERGALAEDEQVPALFDAAHQRCMITLRCRFKKLLATLLAFLFGRLGAPPGSSRSYL